MLKISEIMTDDVFTVSASATVDEVAWALAIRSISGAPVRDRRGRLVGTVSKADLTDPERGSWQSAAHRTAEEVMSPRVVVARADDPAISAVRTLAREGAHQIIVVDREGEVVGIVTPMDVLKALVHGDRFVEYRPHAERPDDSAWEAKATA